MVSPTSRDTAQPDTNTKTMNSHTSSNSAQPNPAPPSTSRPRRICFCNTPPDYRAYMEPLIPCNNKRCRPRWYHERCVGMDLMPALPAGWYCHQCKNLAPAIPLQDCVCVCDTPPYVSGPLRECAKKEECKVRWFHYPCTRAQGDDGGEWICRECKRKFEEEDGSEEKDEGAADGNSGADGGGVEGGDGMPDDTEDSATGVPKRKRDDDDETAPAEKKRDTGDEGAGDEVGLARSQSPEPEPESSLEPQVEFCICATPASEEMVACDAGDDCAHKWYHFECVGLTEATVPEGEWFCEDCLKRKDEGAEKNTSMGSLG